MHYVAETMAWTIMYRKLLFWAADEYYDSAYASTVTYHLNLPMRLILWMSVACACPNKVYMSAMTSKRNINVEVGGASRDISIVCHQVFYISHEESKAFFRRIFSGGAISMWSKLETKTLVEHNSRYKNNKPRATQTKTIMVHSACLCSYRVRSTCWRYEKYAPTCTPRILAVGATLKTIMTRGKE